MQQNLQNATICRTGINKNLAATLQASTPASQPAAERENALHSAKAFGNVTKLPSPDTFNTCSTPSESYPNTFLLYS